MAVTEELPERLPCGADLPTVLEQAFERPDAPLTGHQVRCVHCSAALAEYSRLFAPVRAAVAEVVLPPPDLLDAVLRQVRRLAGSPGWAVIAGSDGATRISTEVVVRAVRSTVDAVPGVRVSLVDAEPRPTAGSPGPRPGARTTGPVPAGGIAVGTTGSTVAVEVTVAADYGTNLPALGRVVNDRVREVLFRMFGLRTAASTVHIDDVLAHSG